MARVVGGAFLFLLGTLWFGQGIGVVGGSGMTGQAFWAVVGAVLVILGLTLIARSRGRDRQIR